MITLTTKPGGVQRLVATDAKVRFVFQRKDGEINAPTNQSGFLRIQLDAGHNLTDGSYIAIYDTAEDRIHTATVTFVSTNVFDTDLAWEARFATDFDNSYVLNYTERNNHYVELRIKVFKAVESGGSISQIEIYRSPLRFTGNSKGLITCDISPLLRAEVSGEKMGDYDTIDVEGNQSGAFEVEYRERYDGDTNAWTEEGFTWWYAYMQRSEAQTEDLDDYVPDLSGQGIPFNEFERPVLFRGYPFDFQFFWPSSVSALLAIITQYNASGTQVKHNEIPLDDDAKGKMCSVALAPTFVHAQASRIQVIIESAL